LVVERAGLKPFWAQALLIPPVVVFNFLTAKFWSLRAAAPGPPHPP
jgi:hypothetical protein